MRNIKLFCPKCGRCIGGSTSTDDSVVEKVLVEKPIHLKKKQAIYGVKCIKCKSHIYVSIEFTN